jgi:hypothetical protein
LLVKRFLWLTDLNSAFDRISRYELALWGQIGNQPATTVRIKRGSFTHIHSTKPLTDPRTFPTTIEVLGDTLPALGGFG